MRSFTVTGTAPAASTAARTTSARSRRLTGGAASSTVAGPDPYSCSERSWEMARHPPAERIRSLQLYGSDPATVEEAARRLVAGDDARGVAPVDHIDLNFGCPVPKVMRGGGGAALPVKRRAAAATLHARTALQGYAGKARWEAIATLKAALPDTPVLGNGDVWSAEDALAMVAATGCDGVVVGRGCLGRPWLFADLARVFAGEAPAGPPRLEAIVATVRRHLALAVDWSDHEPSTARRQSGSPAGTSAGACG